MPDKELNDQFVAKVKDLEVEKMLEQTKEFSDCYKDNNKYDEKNPIENEKNIQLATDCFKNKLTNGQKSKEELQKLSSKLNLEGYGLVKSKNVNEITQYLTDKMYKAMTGYTRKEKDQQKLIESMKFGNKKMIDQSTFIELYITQLSKSALQQVTRYCFEDFRVEDGSTSKTKPSTFNTYWNTHYSSLDGNVYTDTGYPSFFDEDKIAQTDKSDKYKIIMESISTDQISSKDLSKFFMVCRNQILKLCEEFENKFEKNTKNVTIDLSKSAGATPQRGSKSCLVKNNLQHYRKALTETEKVREQFKKLDGEGVALFLDGGGTAKVFNPVNDPNNSIDDLTSQSSKDILEGNTDAVAELAAKCKQKSTEPDCDKFYLEGDSHNKAEFDMQVQMGLKKEVELARIKEILKAKDSSLKDYLIDNGYLKLADDLENNRIKDSEISDLVGKEFDARKAAAVLEFRNKVGKRQISEGEMAKETDKDGKKAELIKDNANVALSEKARLAQVVMFNNIIVSSLDLRDENDNSIGQNTGALQKEVADLGESGIKTNFFQGLRQTANDGKSNTVGDKSTLGAIGLIETILGKPEKETKSPSPK